MTDAEFGTFYVPGPTEIRPALLAQMVRPIMGHRGRAFEAMFARIEAGLRDIFLTARPVYIGAASATGFMEMAIRNLPEGRILSLVNGGFSERFAQVAESCARDVERVVVPWGGVFDLNAVEAALAKSRFIAVTVAHSETSTGVLTDVQAVTALAHKHGAMSIVDSVSGAGGAELMFDAWQIDFLVTASQKAMALPAGLAFAVASTDYIERARGVAHRGFYFDVLQYDKYAEKNQTPSTPATSLLYALEMQVGDIGREGIERRWERHLQMRDATIEWVSVVRDRRNIDIRVLAPEDSRSPTVSVIMLPAGMKGPELSESVKARGFTIGGGYGELKDTSVRVGHMGDHSVDGVQRCLHAVEMSLAELAERRRLVRV
ncbi:MAG TPA: alanine--glyoxylate aminotransferase family protein [Gemmatimonadaceae bacterium]|nr:alanine--glyoxylate aminotransferase family protein [Gemmatimonadaceae bacterium]